MAERVGFVPVEGATLNDLGLNSIARNSKNTQNPGSRDKTGTVNCGRETHPLHRPVSRPRLITTRRRLDTRAAVSERFASIARSHEMRSVSITSMANTCGFCGRPGVTKEHPWSDWMRKVILESRAAAGQKHFQAEIERGGEAKRYKNPTLEQTIGMPCDKANGRPWEVGRERSLVTEVFRLHPDRLAIAVDHDRQAGGLVAEHGVSDALLEGFVDQVTVLDKNTIDVFGRRRLHGLP